MAVETLIYNVLKDLTAWLRKRFSKPDPAETVRERASRKREFEENLRWIDDMDAYGEAIVRDISRVDSYPDIEQERKGISPWFRVGLIGLYHRGVEVGLRIEGLKYEPEHEAWRYSNYKGNEESDLSAFLIGRIPFEWIVDVDWEGDEYYGIPHIYCRFRSRRKEPYEELLFCEKRKTPYRPIYSKVASYDEVQKLSKKMRTGHYA